MPKRLSKKMKGFADDYLNTGNGTQAAINNYNIGGKNPRKTASVIAVENLAKPSIIDYIQAHAKGAATRIVEISKKADTDAVRLNANKDILDRAGLKPIERIETRNTNINARTDLSQFKDLRDEFEEKLRARLESHE